jgi:WD40 repeat protein
MIEYHRILALYFDRKPLYLDATIGNKPGIRKVVEQPWQQVQAKMWDEVTNTLCDLDFIQAKAAAKMSYDLVDDYNFALNRIPDNEKNVREEKEWQRRMDRYTRDLITYADGEISELYIPDSITPWTKEQTITEIERIKNAPSNTDRLKDFNNFLGNESYNLQQYASEIAHFSAQQAWNYSADGPVGKELNQFPENILKSLFLRIQPTRPQWNPFPKAAKVLIGHSDTITSVVITPDGSRAISASEDKTCIVWDLKRAMPVHTLIGHTDIVTCVAMTPDGLRAVSSSRDKTCILWNLETGKIDKVLKGHKDFVNSVSITPNGKKAITGSKDKTVKIWDLESGEPLLTINKDSAISVVTCTPDGKKALYGNVYPYEIELFDIKKNQAIKPLNGHTNSIETLSITPDGKRALTHSMFLNIPTQPKSEQTLLMLWDIEKGEVLNSFKDLVGCLHPFLEPMDQTLWVTSTSITSDGKKAFFGSGDNLCMLWDIEKNVVLQTFSGHKDSVTSVSITPDGKWALSGSLDKTCIFWDLEKGINRDKENKNESTFSVNSVSITPDYTKAISCSSNHRLMFNPKNEEEIIRERNKPWESYTSGDCVLWDLKTGNQLLTFNLDNEDKGWITAISITPDCKIGLSDSFSNKVILWNISTGEKVKTLGNDNERYSILKNSISPDGKNAIFNLSVGTCILFDLANEVQLQIQNHATIVNTVCYTPDGKRALIGSSNRYNFIITEKRSDSDKSFMDNDLVHRLIQIKDDKTNFLWNLDDGKTFQILNGYNSTVTSISITPDGKNALSAFEQTGCVLSNLKTGNILKILKGHHSVITSTSITHDGKRALTGSEDKTCILWDLSTGGIISCFVSTSSINSMEIFPGGVVFGCASGEVLILNSDKLYPSIPIITIRQIWDFEFEHFTKPFADCPLCMNHFEPDLLIIQTIIQILQKANIKPEQSPCFELPDDAWEDPGLVGECPSCHERIKYNPFFGSDTGRIEEYIFQTSWNLQYKEILDTAEQAFKEENWENASSLYSRLVQQGKFDPDYLRYQIALCDLNSLSDKTPEKVDHINNLIKLLQDNSAREKVQMLKNKLNERLELIKQQEALMKQAEKPWWKKLF